MKLKVRVTALFGTGKSPFYHFQAQSNAVGSSRAGDGPLLGYGPCLAALLPAPPSETALEDGGQNHPRQLGRL